MRYAWILAFFWISTTGTAAPRMDRPNIIFITADSLTFDRLESFGSAASRVKEVDRLANGGARFENFYVSPGDSVTTASLLTGRYPFRHGWMWHNAVERWGPPSLSPDRETTLARVLREFGYRTAIVGKWELNDPRKEPNSLREHGFERTCLWLGDKSLIEGKELPYRNPEIFEDGEYSRRKDVSASSLLQDYALKFVEANQDHPFFLYLPMPESSSHFKEVFKNTLVMGGNPRELGSRALLSMVVGLVSALDQLKLDRQTIVVLTRVGLESGSQSLRETAVKAPLVVFGTHRVRKGVIRDLVDFSDLFPTLIELAGVKKPQGLVIDGRSFAPQLRGDTGQPREWVFSQYGTDRVLRNGQYKIYSNGRFYNLLSDPNEEHNLARASVSEVVAERERLRKLLKGMPADKPLNFPYARRLRIRTR